MTGARRATFICLVVLALAVAGCDDKHATDTTAANVDSSEASTTPTTLTASGQCVLLRQQEKEVRAAQADIARKLEAARASDPRGQAANTLAAQRTQLQHELADLDALIAPFDAVNGPSACPPG